MKKKWRYIMPFTVLPLIWVAAAFGGNIQFSKHNLSVGGAGEVKAVSESQICIFCHTPHSARQDIPYLWNRQDQTVSYIPYQSSTLVARVGQPTGASKLCLSCHDGTIALGAVVSEPEEIQFQGGIRFIPEGPSRIGTDLSDDHPVSFVYDSNLALAKPGLADPALLPPEIKLDDYGQLQCTACHDPHDDAFGNFLVMSNQFSGLCTSCHAMEGWEFSSHALSNARWNGRGANPWPNTDFQTVAENGCENCHQPHTAPRPARLLKQVFEEDTCLVCHNGDVAATDIESELTKPYGHFVQDYLGIHDASEDFTLVGVRPHVECEDCHNSHMANGNPSIGAPRVSGANTGVSGIDAAGQQVRRAQNLYAICYKCHAEYNLIPTLRITRQIDQFNTRLEFNLANPSFHPVESAGVNLEVPSLLSPYTVSSIISCIDCHNNSDEMGPKGPHGSSFEYLLERNYITLDFTDENPSTYALCYKCHSRQSILDNQSFSKHKEHIQDARTPCSACHDPHGISNTQGSPINNSHLINFDLKIVGPDSRGRLQFDDLGRFAGQCYLNCHGKEHSPERYPVY
jgi:predicted CXXCH cytochrome family protein